MLLALPAVLSAHPAPVRHPCWHQLTPGPRAASCRASTQGPTEAEKNPFSGRPPSTAWLRVSLCPWGVGAGNEFLLNLALGRASFGPRNCFLSAQKGQNLWFSRADLGSGA